MMRTTSIVWLMIMQVAFGSDGVGPIPTTIHSMKYPQLGLQAQLSGTVRFVQAVSPSFELIYEFKLEGTTDSCGQTDFGFDAPNEILVQAPTPHGCLES